jgi:predicted O-methyltransferase YrrM
MAGPLDLERITDWLDGLVPGRGPVMAALEAEAAESGFPIIGPATGNLCYLLARLTGARRVCELGSGFGYSTVWFARAVRENGGGEVHHTVMDEALSGRARRVLGELGLLESVVFHVGEAVATLYELDGSFDLVFLDIDKDGYPAALPVIETKLRAGGLLIADNLIWHGRIFDEDDRSNATEGVRSFTRMVTESPDWTATVVPVRDGVLVARWEPVANE